MGFWIVLGLVVLVGGAIVVRPRYRFALTFVDGRLTRRTGAISGGRLAAFEDIARQCRLTGTVRSLAEKQISFSSTVPADVRQRLRNAFLANR